jgi:hypothetical protein
MKYTTTFSSSIKPLVAEEKDKYLAMASLLEVSKFVPGIDTEKNIDLLPIAFNACVVNRVNKNGDVIDTPTALDVYKDFINKPINIEHDRQKIIGTILTAGFSEFGTDKPLTEEEMREFDGPFNITLGGVVWRIVNSNLTDLIEESNDPTSENYQKISASWELGFSDFDLVILDKDEKNIENAITISSSVEKDALKSFLRSQGGAGELEDGRCIYRKVIEQVVPLGIGLTETPAADVKGVAVKEEKEEAEADENAGYPPNCKKGYEEKDGKCVKVAKKVKYGGAEAPQSEPETAKKTSHSRDNNVNIKKDVVMKITCMKDINDDTLKTLEASAVHDFIQDEIRKESEKFATEKEQKEKALKDADEKLNSVSNDYDKVQEELKQVGETLNTLQEEVTKKEAEELFNQRMASFDEEYELTDEDRKVISSDIKELNEESYSAYQEKMAILLKSKNKEVLVAAAEEAAKASEEQKEPKPEAKEEQTEEVKASEENTEEVMEEALNNAEVEKDAVATSTEAEEPTLYDKYKDAFSLENFNINN